MPKTKKSSRNNKSLNWFKPTSPAKGILLFAIAFAVIGGGYMAYKSFALSSIVHGANQISNGGDAYTTNDCSGSKGCVTAWVVVPPSGNINSTFSLPGTISLPGEYGKSCFTARLASNKTSGDVIFSVRVSSYQVIQKLFSVTSTSYHTYCTGPHDTAPGSFNWNLKATTRNGSNIVVSSMSFEF